jgi:hypothetical protein
MIEDLHTLGCIDGKPHGASSGGKKDVSVDPDV